MHILVSVTAYPDENSGRRKHTGFVGDAKLLENLHCVLHGVPVRTGAHDNADLYVHGGLGQALPAVLSTARGRCRNSSQSPLLPLVKHNDQRYR